MSKQGLDDYLEINKKDGLKELMVNARVPKLKDIQQTLTGNLAKTVQFPIEIFSNPLKDLLIELYERHDAPLEYIGSLFIAFASVLMLGKYRILVNPKKNWHDDPIIWLAVVGNPSQKKTPILNLFKSPIDKIENGLNAEYEEKYEQYKKELREYKTEFKKYESGNRKEPPKEPIEPQKQRLTTQNATVEALLRAIAKNNTGIKRAVSVVVDELTSLLKGMGQYKNGNGNDQEYYLQAWKRQQTNIIRQSANLDYTIAVYHTIIGTIQPKVLDNTLFDSGIESSNGMIERWLFATSKYEETGKEYSGDEPYNINVIEQIFNKLYSYNGEERVYKFSPEAQTVFNTYCLSIVKGKKSDKINDLTKNYMQKQTDYVARFSLILHCIENPDDTNLTIYPQTVKNAVLLSQYFLTCFTDIALQRLNTIPLSDHALSYILTRGLKRISPTKLYKSNTSRYKNPELTYIALEHLANRGYGRLQKSQNSGISFIVYAP